MIKVDRLQELLQSGHEYLRLKEPRVTALPLALCELPCFANLRILNLRGCNLTSLPPQITRLRLLQHLDVTDNHRLRLPSQLAKLNLQRFLCSPSLLDTPETWDVPYTPDLCSTYCGDRRYKALPSLTQAAATAVLEEASLTELDDLRDDVPPHLLSWLYPHVCHECGRRGHVPIATRVRKAVIAFKLVPLHYSVCSPTCLDRLQDTFRLDDLLNLEKRAARQAKFGLTGTSQHNIYDLAP